MGLELVFDKVRKLIQCLLGLLRLIAPVCIQKIPQVVFPQGLFSSIVDYLLGFKVVQDLNYEAAFYILIECPILYFFTIGLDPPIGFLIRQIKHGLLDTTLSI